MYLLQKKVVRIVCGVGYREHTNELFSELRILKLIDIVKLRSACIMYKAHKKLLPNNLQLLTSSTLSPDISGLETGVYVDG